MRERINQLAKGIIDAEVPLITLVPSTIEEKVSLGELKSGKFTIDSENELSIRGLAYSSNARVKVKKDAFGGLHNFISYEVNSDYLEHGDEIKGSFHLVTNSGEREIPYSFQVEAKQAEQTLRQLKTPTDFAQLAKLDLDTAIRIFEIPEFVEAPFMQDLRARTLYEALRDHGNRYHQLEEFLVALKAKDPVTVKIQETKKYYENLIELTPDAIVIEKDCWGYVSIQVKADGDFIQLIKKTATEPDFRSNSFRIPYQINPKQLHRGRNFGCITVMVGEHVIPITVQVDGNDHSLDLQIDSNSYKEDFKQYLLLRLEFEKRIIDRQDLVSQMLVQIEKIRLYDHQNPLFALCQAELYLLKGQVNKAIPILEQNRAEILSLRQEQRELYCFYQYLILQVVPDESQQESFLRLIYKYWEMKQIGGPILLLILKLDPDMLTNPEYCLIQMKKMFRQGCHSPFLYGEACRIWNDQPDLLQNLEPFELQALNYGAKKGVIGAELCLATSRMIGMVKRHHKLLHKILKNLYHKYPEKELLSDICSLLIRENCQEKADFYWYEKALQEKISLTRLYEYFLYSLPSDYKELIPKEVLLYFSYDHDLDVQSKSVLYHNILTYLDPTDDIYKQYEREIGKFATDQLLNVRMNNRLAVIYDHMIYQDMIDESMAKVLPAMLKANRLHCDNPAMKYVVICYEELTSEETYSLTKGTAYIPLFSPNCVILFQDLYGNRFSNVSYTKQRVLVKPDLEARCFELYPTHPMLLLHAGKEIIKRESIDEVDVQILERLLAELDVHPYFEKQIRNHILQYYKQSLKEEGSSSYNDYLLHLNLHKLTRKERNLVCECLIANHLNREAYELLQEYGWEGVADKQLLKLADKMILQQLFDQDEWLLQLAYYLFQRDQHDRVVLDYLCEYYNGDSMQMYQVLRQSLLDHVETYDMEERLLAQMLFSNYQELVDQVFDWYVLKKKISEKIVQAFFTMKCAEYVLDNIPTKERVFSYLEATIQKMLQKNKIPTLYLLGLCKYYATLPILTGEQQELCKMMMGVLRTQGIVLAFMKDLAKHIPISDDLLDKGIIQYHGQKTSHVELQIRILPQEEEFRKINIRRMYQGIFVKQLVLFEGEIIEYQIYESINNQRQLMEEGSVTCELSTKNREHSRFTEINKMSLYHTVKEDKKLKLAMQEYMIKNAAVGTLFKTM